MIKLAEKLNEVIDTREMKYLQKKIKIVNEGETTSFTGDVNEAIIEINGGKNLPDKIIDIKFAIDKGSKVAMIIYFE